MTKILQERKSADGSWVVRSENNGVITEERFHTDGRKDIAVTVRELTVDAESRPLNYAEKIAAEILEKAGGELSVAEFQRRFSERLKKEGIRNG